MTWTLPPPQRGLLQTSESTIRRTIQQVVNGSFDAHLIWNFTLSGEILDRVIFQIGVVRSGKKMEREQNSPPQPYPLLRRYVCSRFVNSLPLFYAFVCGHIRNASKAIRTGTLATQTINMRSFSLKGRRERKKAK